MCHSELGTARWEVRCALGAHQERQDQATERKGDIPLHAWISFQREREEEQRALKLMTFPYLQVCRCVFSVLFEAPGSKQEKQVAVARAAEIRALTANMFSFLLVMSLLWHIRAAIVSIFYINNGSHWINGWLLGCKKGHTFWAHTDQPW